MIHKIQNLHKLPKLLPFSRAQWMEFEERHDHGPKITTTSHRKPKHRFTVIVASDIRDNRATSEVCLDEFERRQRTRSLRYAEFWLNLPTDPARAIAHDAGAKTSFTIYETDDPPRGNIWPFLLIVRTGRIVTVHVINLLGGCNTNEYRRILGVSSK